MTSERFTVLGGSGYVGSHLVPALEARGATVAALGRDDDLFSRDLGHVIYSVAVTNDAHARAGDAVSANVCLVADLLRRATFESFLYLSSAQVYLGADASTEDAHVRLDPRDPGALYRASKVLGEMLCLASDRAEIRVARLSAIYGERLSPRSFLAGVVRDAVEHGRVELRTTLDSERDFVHVDDAVRALAAIAVRGRSRLYNVARGRNTSNAAIMGVLRRETGCTTTVAPGALRTAYPPVNVTRLREELGLEPTADVLSSLPAIVRRQRAAIAQGRP